MLRYSWKSVWNSRDWTFSSLNLLSVAMTMLILVALTGLLQAFKNYTNQVMEKLPLRIEIFKSKDALVEDLSDIEKHIGAVGGVKAIYKRIPTFLSFVNANERVLTGQSGIRGSTVLPAEPWGLIDIYGKPVSLLGKREIADATNKPTPFDEIGIIISFDLLIKLEYLPATAIFDKADTWQQITLPQQIKLYVQEQNAAVSAGGMELPVPIVAIVADLYRGDYAVSEDFYNVFSNWQNAFAYMLCDRHGKPLIAPEAQTVMAHYVLSDEQQLWVEKNQQVFAAYQESLGVKILAEFWEDQNGFEQRLNILPNRSGERLNKQLLEDVENRLRAYAPLENLGPRQEKREQVTVRNWQDFPSIVAKHQYMQAAVYVAHRNHLEAALDRLRSMGLFANSPLERYLKSFARQEQFFTAATVAIFALVLFLSGVVLFSTFYSSILRKNKEIGIFKTYGASRLLVLSLFYLQSTILLGIGCLVGIAGGIEVGRLLSSWLSRFTQASGTVMLFQLPPAYVAILVAIMLGTCWLAIFIPVRIATAIDPAEVVRG
jgi:ABC-type lipoprotein release transport system permease subunit